MITQLPGRFEFFSDAWLDEARKFLERECRNRKEQLGAQRFSLSERFADAPQGYTIIERAISPKFADEVRAATLRALLPHQTFSMNRIRNFR